MAANPTTAGIRAWTRDSKRAHAASGLWVEEEEGSGVVNAAAADAAAGGGGSEAAAAMVGVEDAMANWVFCLFWDSVDRGDPRGQFFKSIEFEGSFAV
jgi:hypothetical protein